MNDERDRLGDKLHQIELAREDQWAHRRDEQLLEKLRRKFAGMLACPRCGRGFIDARISIGIRAALCPNGHGAWLGGRALDQLRIQLENAAAIHRETLGEKLFGEIILYIRHKYPSSTNCPECGSALAAEAAIAPGVWTLTAMTCPKGHGAWINEDMLEVIRTRLSTIASHQ